jgi:hypothetical protein
MSTTFWNFFTNNIRLDIAATTYLLTTKILVLSLTVLLWKMRIMMGTVSLITDGRVRTSVLPLPLEYL